MNKEPDNYHITSKLFPLGIAFEANGRGYIPLTFKRDLSPSSQIIRDEMLMHLNLPNPLKLDVGTTQLYDTREGIFYTRHFYPKQPHTKVPLSDHNSAQALGIITDYSLGKQRIARGMVSVVREPSSQESGECDPSDLSEANLSIVVASTIGHHPILVQDTIHLGFLELAGDPSNRAILRALDMCILRHGYDTLNKTIGTCGIELVASEVEKHGFYHPEITDPFNSYVEKYGNGHTLLLRSHQAEIQEELDKRKSKQLSA